MTEREQFEAAMSAFLDPARVEETFYREGDNYDDYATLFAWEAWQAARATPADHSVPVAIYQVRLADDSWHDTNEHAYQHNIKICPDEVRLVYAHPPAKRCRQYW